MSLPAGACTRGAGEGMPVGCGRLGVGGISKRTDGAGPEVGSGVSVTGTDVSVGWGVLVAGGIGGVFVAGGASDGVGPPAWPCSLKYICGTSVGKTAPLFPPLSV